MVRLKFSKTGLVLFGGFALLFLVCIFSMYRGNWQAIFYVWLATFPFSLACHGLGGWLQTQLSLPHECRASIEAVLLFVVGSIEFYLLGFLLGRSWNQQIR